MLAVQLWLYLFHPSHPVEILVRILVGLLWSVVVVVVVVLVRSTGVELTNYLYQVVDINGM